MTVHQITLHTQNTWIQAIRQFAKNASVCRVAVAYCGAEGYKFFPDEPAQRPQDVPILVDASEAAVRRGLTNPRGLEHLIGLAFQVRTLPGLHAKVFIFDKSAALVGSANLSASSITDQISIGFGAARFNHRSATSFLV